MVHIVFVSAIKGAGDTRFVLLTTLLLSPLPVVLGHFGLSRWNWNLWNFWTVITVWICLLGTIYAARFLQGRWQRMRVIERELLEPATPVAVG